MPEQNTQRQIAMLSWRDGYNAVRPHSKLGGRTPFEAAKQALSRHAPIEIVIPSTISHLAGGL